MTPWHALHDGFVRCASSRARTVLASCPSTISTSASTFGGGDAGGVPSRFSSNHWPRSTGDVRFGYDDTSSTPPLPSKPKRFGSVELDAPEARAAHVVHAVVARQRLVDERVLGRQEIEHAAVGAEHAVDEQARLRDEVVADVAVDVAEHERIRREARELAETQPLEREVRRERLGARIGEHAPTCCSSTAGSPSLSAAASSSSSASGIELHKKNDSRDASSTLDSGYARRRVAPSGFGSNRYRNFGCASTPASAYSTPSSKPPLRGAFVVEPHQARQIVVGERAAERFTRERSDDLARARRLARLPTRDGKRKSCRGSACC